MVACAVALDSRDLVIRIHTGGLETGGDELRSILLSAADDGGVDRRLRWYMSQQLMAPP